LIALTPTWDAIVGVRHSRFDYTQTNDGVRDSSEVSATTWQLATNVRLSDRWSLFGGVNTGFDTESTLGARGANGQPFDPERSRQVEAGLRLEHRAASPQRRGLRSAPHRCADHRPD
jgi:lipopolysaccharide assembly outer membrane protein LptD (OstA)